MRVVIKIILIIVAFIIYGVIQITLKGGESNSPGVGGPIGIIFLFAFLAAARAIWKYNPEKEVESSADNHNLDKS
jgi:hypothetical protein